MARTLSSAIQALIAENRSHVCHLLSFTVGETTYRFAEDRIEFQGETWLPHLALRSPIRYTQKLAVEPVLAELQNITLETAAMLKAEQSDLQGAEAVLQRLFLKAGEAVILLVGRIGQVEVDERKAVLTLAGDLDPTAAQVPSRKYSSLCVWDFKDAKCGYEDGADPNDPATGQPFASCPKDFLSCQARGRQHRFPGFLHVTRDLTEAIEGQLPDAQARERALNDFYVWEEP
ncbi:MAG: DUF2163 domain-containing protein [Acidobacteria bacterium]|nr:DUF2163 domain-containing protein [Acidobacteriota bacterium]